MISEIQTINRLLASIKALETNTGAKEVDVAEYYVTQYVYPVRDIFSNAKDFCFKVGLITIDEEQVHLTNLGEKYLKLGRKAKVVILEPNNKQKYFLSKNVFLVSTMLDLVRKILYYFNRDTDGTLTIEKEKARVLDDQNFLGLLLQLNILIPQENLLALAPQYSEFLEQVISNLIIITPEAFEKSEKIKKELSEIAERYVMQSENNRLTKINALLQSDRIDHVALKNIAAGYDIASFNDANSQTHDRFIEVKSGGNKSIRFFFTRNEFETARRLRENYYIYYVVLKNKEPQEIYTFQNPTEGIMKDSKYKIDVDTYVICET